MKPPPSQHRLDSPPDVRRVAVVGDERLQRRVVALLRERVAIVDVDAADVVVVEAEDDRALAEAILDAAPSTSIVLLADDQREPLTERERNVLAALARGLSNKRVAERLGISEHTVKFHVGSILAKLGAGTRAEAVALGARLGYVML